MNLEPESVPKPRRFKHLLEMGPEVNYWKGTSETDTAKMSDGETQSELVWSPSKHTLIAYTFD